MYLSGMKFKGIEQNGGNFINFRETLKIKRSRYNRYILLKNNFYLNIKPRQVYISRYLRSYCFTYEYLQHF